MKKLIKIENYASQKDSILDKENVILEDCNTGLTYEYISNEWVIKYNNPTVIVSTSPPSGIGSNGDIWLQVT